MRKTIALAAAIIIALCSSAVAAEDMGVSTSALLNEIGIAYTRVQKGLSTVMINSGLKKTETGCYVEYDSAVMLIINEAEDRKVKNVAVTYMEDSEEEQQRYARGGILPSEVVYENICMQVMFALNHDMTKEEARDLLRQIGLYGNVLDGSQRSRALGQYRYIMKMQPNGMLLMVVSHI